MIKSEEIINANSCLNKASDSEPVFVLRAQDALAPQVIRHWAYKALQMGTPLEKVREALNSAQQMEEWQYVHRARVKRPD